MTVMNRMMLGSFAVAAFWFPAILYAVDAPITVEVGDNSACTRTSTAPHTSVDITMTCGNIKIEANVVANGIPQVSLPAADSVDDKLEMKNVKITAVGGPVTDFHIKFYRDFQTPPTTSPDVWYKITATGSLKRGLLAATNDSIKLRSYVKDPSTTGIDVGLGNPYPTGSEIGHTVTCAPAACGNFSPLGTGETATSGFQYLCSQTNSLCLRTLKVDMWFTLTNTGDVLRLDPVNVQKSPPPGGPPEEDAHPLSPQTPPAP